MKSQITNHKSQNGFTLIETLVAITVLLLAVVGPLQIGANALFSTFHARNEITAYYLAAEAIEYVKNARDVTFLNDVFNSGNAPIADSAWLDGLRVCIPDIPNDAIGCRVDATKSFAVEPEAVIACNSPKCPRLNLDDGIFNYDSNLGSVESKFTRKVEITPQGNNLTPEQEAIVKVTVEWQGAAIFGSVKSVVLTAIISNWQRK